MYHIAIVEDEKDFSAQLVEYLEQYKKEHGVELQVSVFPDGESILKDYQPLYDAVFLDIQLPGIDGMQTAEVIRGMDEEVVLMFITNMAQYAISGYAVEALDFVMKPVDYYMFAIKVGRVLKRVQKKERQQHTIVLNLSGGLKKLDAKQIYFIEIQNRMLHYRI